MYTTVAIGGRGGWCWNSVE